MKKGLKIFCIVCFVCISGLLSYKGAYWIGEKYFFDKLFYQKSIKHGYMPPGKDFDYKYFGGRSKDLKALGEFTYKNKNNIRGVSNKNEVYTVAVIGDSYVWGEGVKEDQIFTRVLEKKLNKIRPTKVLSLGECGDSILDYLARYEKVKSVYNIDLNIFSAVNNDALLNRDGRLENDDYKNIISDCQKKYNTDPIYDFYSDDGKKWLENFLKVGNNPVNLCVMERSIELLPTEKSIYFIPQYFWENAEDIVLYRNFLSKYSKNILLSSSGENIKEYQPLFSGNAFQVSKKEGHPSVMAHQMYADVLYREITNNPKWKFKK